MFETDTVNLVCCAVHALEMRIQFRSVVPISEFSFPLLSRASSRKVLTFGDVAPASQNGQIWYTLSELTVW